MGAGTPGFSERVKKLAPVDSDDVLEERIAAIAKRPLPPLPEKGVDASTKKEKKQSETASANEKKDVKKKSDVQEKQKTPTHDGDAKQTEKKTVSKNALAHSDEKKPSEKKEEPAAEKTSDKKNQDTTAAKKAASKKVAEMFVMPERIKNDVAFWSKVYREWDTNQVIFYDEKSKVVYDVVVLPKIPFELSAPKFRKTIQDRIDEIRAILSDREKKPTGKKRFSDLSKSIAATIKKNGLDAEIGLSDRVRSQSGLRSLFEFGLRNSGRYADDMKAILRSQGLPEDLLALVFVESLFSLSAVSHAGATGPWGIMKATAKQLGIEVNNFTDERLDPWVATWCAAQYLKKAKENLVEWPLAITSYNYGYAGMMRAVNNWGRDFETILDNHDGNWFGYASKSYYAEFLAARDTILNQEKYFPGLKKESRWQYELVHVDHAVDVTDLYSLKAISREDLASLNPSLTRRTLNGQEVIPSNYHIRVPKKKGSHFYAQLKKVPANRRKAALNKISVKYLARGRESIAQIARNFGVHPMFLSERMGKPLNYQPKGAVIIRSQAHRFSSLSDINKQLVSSFSVPAGANVVEGGRVVR